MEFNKTFLACHKFYDAKGRRLSIFGKYMPNNKIKIYVFTCSKRYRNRKGEMVGDNFSKKESWRLLQQYLYKDFEEQPEAKPTIFSIPSTSSSTRKDFMNFCYDQFYYHTYLRIGVEGTEQMIVADLLKNDKLGIITFHVKDLSVKKIPKSELDAYNKSKEASDIMNKDNSIDKVNEIIRKSTLN